jgi:hypothetical protein
MSDAERVSEEYVVEYVDGPLAGETDRRVLIGGRYDDRLGAVAAVEGLESLFWYNAGESREIQGELHVQYTFDAPDSDPVEAVRDDE